MSNAINQKQKVRFSRNIIPVEIMECVRNNKGIATRQQILTHVADAIGLSAEERDAVIVNKTGVYDKPTSYFNTVVAYECLDIKREKYKGLNLTNEDGEWMTDEVIPTYEEMREIIHQTKLASSSKEKLKTYAKQALSKYFYALPVAVRERNSSIQMRELVALMIRDRLTASATINSVLK